MNAIENRKFQIWSVCLNCAALCLAAPHAGPLNRLNSFTIEQTIFSNIERARKPGPASEPDHLSTSHLRLLSTRLPSAIVAVCDASGGGLASTFRSSSRSWNPKSHFPITFEGHSPIRAKDIPKTLLFAPTFARRGLTACMTAGTSRRAAANHSMRRSNVPDQEGEVVCRADRCGHSTGIGGMRSR